MKINAESFAQVVAGLLERYCAQNGLPAPAPTSGLTIGVRLWDLLEERGWPRPLAPGETGVPGGMPAGEVAAMAARLLAGVDAVQQAAWAEPVRQLIKACFHPRFRICRDSYRECSPDGSCRRQELARVRQRLSGTHCVDCPHWTALNPARHVRMLEHHWRPGRWPEFLAEPGIYLPEDFRRFRQMLYARKQGIKP